MYKLYLHWIFNLYLLHIVLFQGKIVVVAGSLLSFLADQDTSLQATGAAAREAAGVGDLQEVGVVDHVSIFHPGPKVNLDLLWLSIGPEM